MNFFQYQTVTPYTFVSASGNTYTIGITDITQHSKIQERLQPYMSAFYDYEIPDGYRPDNVALSVYGDAKYTWLVLSVNNITSLYDWPLDNDEFERYLISKYGSLDTATAVTTENNYYYDATGNKVTYAAYVALSTSDKGKVLPARYCYTAAGYRIDPETYDTLSADERGDVKTPYIKELDDNEAKRRIKVILRQFLPGIEQSLKTLYRS
jgi:hypothetical protein